MFYAQRDATKDLTVAHTQKAFWYSFDSIFFEVKIAQSLVVVVAVVVLVEILPKMYQKYDS